MPQFSNLRDKGVVNTPFIGSLLRRKEQKLEYLGARGCSLNDGFLLPLFLLNVVPICYLKSFFLSQPHLPQTENMD